MESVHFAKMPPTLGVRAVIHTCAITTSFIQWIGRIQLASLAIGLVLNAHSGLAQTNRIAGAGTLPTTSPARGVDVLTRSYDIARSGADTHEATLHLTSWVEACVSCSVST
jgi:hypothetical protein